MMGEGFWNRKHRPSKTTPNILETCAKENLLIFLFCAIQSIFIANLMNFLENPSPWTLWFFSFFLYTFFLPQVSFLVWIVLPEVKMGHSSENIPQCLWVNRGLLICKTCSYVWMAQGIIRKTAGSSPAPYSIWKEVKFSLFKQNAFPKPTFIEEYFRTDSTGKGSFRSQSLPAHPITAQPCRLNALFTGGKSERPRPLLPLCPGEITLSGGHMRLIFTPRSPGLPAVTLLHSIYTTEY